MLSWLTGTDGETAFTISSMMKHFTAATERKSKIKDFSLHGRNKNEDHGFLVQPDLRINLN